MKNIVFFIRAFNDVDHLMPIIYRISKSPDFSIRVFCIDPKFDFRNNDNVRFLKSRCEVIVKYLYHEVAGSRLREKAWGKLLKISRRLNSYRFPSIVKKVIMRVNQLSSKKLINRLKDLPGWENEFIKRINPSCLIFDWLNPDAFGVTSILVKAKDLGISTLSLPHGMNLYTNFDILPDRKISKKEANYFDFIVSQGKLSRMHLENEGTPPEKIVDLGSLRFCDEWMDFYRENILSSTFDSPCDIAKLRVAFFLSKLQYNIDEKLIIKTIEILVQEEDTYVIIKPHTRGMSTHFMKELIEKYHIDIREETSSVLLSEWADVGLVIGSSVGLQILHDGKLLLYLCYLDSNQSFYDEVGACWKIGSIGELKDALRTLKTDKKYRPYSQEDVQNLFNHNVYAGDPTRDVIEDYFNIITNPPDR